LCGDSGDDDSRQTKGGFFRRAISISACSLKCATAPSQHLLFRRREQRPGDLLARPLLQPRTALDPHRRSIANGFGIRHAPSCRLSSTIHAAPNTRGVRAQGQGPPQPRSSIRRGGHVVCRRNGRLASSAGCHDGVQHVFLFSGLPFAPYVCDLFGATVRAPPKRHG